MSFVYNSYLPVIVIVASVLIFLLIKNEKAYFKWVELHWFYKRSLTSKLSSFFYYISIILILFSLLDLRGKEQQVESKVSDQKTIILIDSSSSMLAEDVRPNRFNKAILLARHFAKKAVGHQISVIVFSDGNKQIIPFTKDIDLVDAKLLALEKLQLDRGGTGLTSAIQEAIQYFKVDGSSDSLGNILIFTDAEEHEAMFDMQIPNEVSVGIVGVGTIKGTTIPIRDNRGIFRGNKNYEGKAIVTKLDEDFLKKLSSKIKNYQYWIASSYSLPTKNILNFFNTVFKMKTSDESFRIRPVLVEYLLLPAVLLLGLSFILRFFKSFSLVFLFLIFNTSYANVKVKKEKSQIIQKLEKQYLEGTLNKDERLYLADKLLKEGFSEQANIIYEEALENKITKENKKDFFNWSASQLKSNQIGKGVENYLKLLNHLEKSKDSEDKQMLEDVKKNLMKALRVQEQQQKQKKKEKENKDNKDSKEKKESGSEKSDEINKSKEENGEVKDGEKKKKSDKESKEKDKNGKDGKEIEDKDGEKQDVKEEDKNGEKKSKPSDKDSKESKVEKNKDLSDQKGEMKKKIPVLLKQLMSKDNQLQKMFIDAETSKRSKKNRKDW